MTNNTIPNVPRDDLDLIRAALEGFKPCIARDDALRTVRALLSAPSPAGVDGLEVVAYRVSLPSEPELGTWLDDDAENEPQMCLHEPLCRLSDAQAIIDWLRGEVAELVKHSEVVAQWHADAMFAIRDLKDANAVRIDGLERLLTRAQIWIVDETGPGWELSESIDAALSAGKEVE